MKHLKIKAELLDGNCKVKVTILANSHAKNFGFKGRSSYWGVGYGSFVYEHLRMYSTGDTAHPPEFGRYLYDSNLQVSLKFRVGYVGSSCVVNVNEYKIIKEAIIAYNEWGLTHD